MTTPPKKKKAPTVAAVEALRTEQSTAKFSAKSTGTKAQLKRLVALLRLRPHHTYELRAKGISHPAGRVRNLIACGFEIESARITTLDANGFQHVGVAIYTLIAEPEAS